MTMEVTKGPKSDKEILRVALDKRATDAYRSMVERLKGASPFVKFHPSDFASFIMADFFETYFEKDIDVLMAEFFDSHGFLAAETLTSKDSEKFEESMRVALAKAEKIKSKRRNKIQKAKKEPKTKESVLTFAKP